MAFGPAICACCGATEGVEEHHLYLRADGCPDDLTVWLCHDCHGRAHGMKRRTNIREATKTALAAARARGVKLGNPTLRAGDPETARRARAARSTLAAERAGDVLPHITAAKAAGCTSLRQIAEALTSRSVRAPGGGTTWDATQVRRVLLTAASTA